MTIALTQTLDQMLIMLLSSDQTENIDSKKKKSYSFMSKYLRNEGRSDSGIKLHVKDAFQNLLITFELVTEKKNY